MRNKKWVKILCGILLLPLISVAADLVLWVLSPSSRTTDSSHTWIPEEMILSGWNVEEGLYIPRDGVYGQINFSSPIQDAERLTVQFNEPLPQDTNIRVYWGMAMEELAGPDYVNYTFPKGRSTATLHFPKGNWTEYRINCYGNISLREVIVGQKTTWLPYSPNLIRIVFFSTLFFLLWILYSCVKPFQTGLTAAYRHLIHPETRLKSVDYLYMAFALVMLLHLIYSSLQYFAVQIQAEPFRIPMLIFAVISVILGRTWRDKGFWILTALLAIAFIRIYFFNYDSYDTTYPFLISGIYAVFGCYATAHAIRPSMRKTFLLIFCGLWTAAIAALSIIGIHTARTGMAIGGFRTLQLLENRLYLIRHPVNSGILESVSIAIALLGTALSKNRIAKTLFVLSILPMLIAGVLTATRTNYILTAVILSMTLCLLFYDKLRPQKRGNGYHLRAWKWAVLVLTFIAVSAAAALIQPYIIDGFNAFSANKEILLKHAMAEDAVKNTVIIDNRNFANAAVFSLTGRLDVWKCLFRILGQDLHTLLYGQSLDYSMEAVNALARPLVGWDVHHCHNTTLQILYENGFAAMLLYLAFQISFLYHAYKLMTDPERPCWQRMVPIPAIACLIGDLVDITAYFRCGNPQMVILYLFSGMTIMLAHKNKERTEKTGGPSIGTIKN